MKWQEMSKELAAAFLKYAGQGFIYSQGGIGHRWRGNIPSHPPAFPGSGEGKKV